MNITFLNFKRWHGCAATIEMDPGSEVYGILWELDNAHLSTLDDQEGVSKKVYRRFEVEVMEIKYHQWMWLENYDLLEISISIFNFQLYS